MNMMKKILDLGDLKHGWLLVVSVLTCGLFFYWDRTEYANLPLSVNPDDQLWLSIGYGISFALAILWSIVNYISHIRLNALYRKQQDIESYVEQLTMSHDDKTELRNYLEDFARDLVSKGMSEHEAVRKAVNEFQVKELLSLSKNSAFFHLHSHYYLFGWSLLAYVLLIITVVIDGLFIGSANAVITVIVETILLVYGTALIFLFVVYKAVDAWIYRTMHQYFNS